MIVLFEGGEGAGKTTVCKRLEAEHGFTYLKFPTPKSAWERVIFSKDADIGEKAAAATLDFLDVLRPYRDTKQNIVMDRGPLSTIAYQDVDNLCKMIYGMHGEWAISMITHAYVLDVDVERGLAREAAKNAVSAQAISFHTEVNARMRDAAHYMVVDQKFQTIIKELDRYQVPDNTIRNMRLALESGSMPFKSGLESDLAKQTQFSAFLRLPWKLTDAALIDTNNSTPESTYLEILGRLGLGGQAPTSGPEAIRVDRAGFVPAAAACQLEAGSNGV